MAGDWIAWEKGLPLKREVMAIANKLGLDRRVVACLCMETWSWADSETADGCIPGIEPTCIDDVVGIVGFGQAMMDVGWILTDAQGLIFPNWDRKNSKSAKRRLRENGRRRQQRNGDEA